MKESKIEITERLRADGRWQEAARLKDETVKRLRDEGKPAKEARELAWEEMANTYPPLQSTGDNGDFEGVAAKQIAELAGAPLDPAGDVLWCYRHVENPIVKVTDAPSLGAWGLLKYARANRQRFYENLLPNALATRGTRDDVTPVVQPDRDQGELERLLGNWAEPS